MDAKIGVVICNYNKCDFVINCITSILNSTYKDIVVYIVDNASIDSSADKIEKIFGNRVTLIRNQENLGGSGGFNTGLRAALKRNHQYLMCVDNDITMDADNIKLLHDFLESHPQVGMAGSKICRMREPERLQEMGADIDFDICMIRPHFKDYLDDDSLPLVQYCDYVPACSLMVRREVIDKVGLMPEENFIYWDDMEWGYRINQAGYRVASYREAIVYHDMGTNSGDSYFSTYYFWRNRIRFFLKFTPADKKEHMVHVLLESLFQTLYGCYYKGKENQIQVMMYAFDDAVHGTDGKAAEYKILPKDFVEDRIKILMSQYSEVGIVFNGDMKLLKELVQKAELITTKVNITIYAENTRLLKQQYPDFQIESIAKSNIRVSETNKQLILCMCKHVSEVMDFTLKMIYVDSYNNLLENMQDMTHFQNYSYLRNLFIKCQKVLMLSSNCED